MKTRLFLFLITACAAAILIFSSLPAQAQCVVRTDWPTYTIVRGDRLSRIAQRYGISLRDLAAANCIVNVNRIYYGQQIRVPPMGVPTRPVVVTPVVTPPASPGTPVTGSYQPFENGLMIWRADTSAIWVLYNNGTGTQYTAPVYSALPERPFFSPIPAGRFHPILGFGRIWSNLADVRNALGWATQPEQGATIVPQNGGANLVTIASGQTQLVIQVGSRSWSYLYGAPPVNPPPVVTVPPVVPQILTFSASPTTASVGQTVAINWQVQGVQSAMIEINNAGTSQEPEVTLTGLALSGSTNFVVPNDYGGSGMWLTLYGVNTLANGAVQRVISSSFFVGVNPLPTTGTSVYSAYQPYDNGFMVWRSDTGDIYVFYSFGAVATYPVSYYGTFPENPSTAPTPPGKVRPISGFGRVWGNQPTIMAQLGWATAPEQGYTSVIETLPDGRMRLSLPNGNSVTFGYGVWGG